jgi:putative ATP-dependent endonuclease of OLD family
MSENYIEKIHCLNFRGFRSRKLEGLNKGINILIGDNDTGKSTLLLAIDLVLGANPNRVETIGLDRLINQQAIDEFLNQDC